MQDGASDRAEGTLSVFRDSTSTTSTGRKERGRESILRTEGAEAGTGPESPSAGCLFSIKYHIHLFKS